MSYRKEDHIPDRLMVRKCLMCGDEFQQMNWWQTICPDCEFESDLEDDAMNGEEGEDDSKQED